MEKRTLAENIFTTLAKNLVAAKIGNMIKKAEEDPTLQATLSALKFHTDELDRQLENLCKRNPQSKLCKEKNRGK